MKIIVCGPPHSGKSVFVASLERLLPSDGYETIRINKDGEGDWSNNPDQEQIRIIRKKLADYNEEFIKSECEIIKKSTKPIMLVDIGGMLFPDKIPIFKACDRFIVLSRDEIHREEWKRFGEYLGAKCIAELDSKQNAEDSVESFENGSVKGIVGKLERGTWHEKSPVLKWIADEIIEKSGYHELKNNIQPDDVVDFNKIARDLNYGELRMSREKEVFSNVKFPEKSAAKIKEILSGLPGRKSYRIDGARANWISALAVETLFDKGVEDISIYDTKNVSFIAVKKLPCAARHEMISPSIRESEKSVFIDLDLSETKLEYSDLEKIVLPKIDESKQLYLSGKMPNWLLDSISISYGNKEKHVLQGGKSFICYKSECEEKLGSCSDSPDGIDIKKFFEKQKQKVK